MQDAAGQFWASSAAHSCLLLDHHNGAQAHSRKQQAPERLRSLRSPRALSHCCSPQPVAAVHQPSCRPVGRAPGASSFTRA
jgi:hypothetical protein